MVKMVQFMVRADGYDHEAFDSEVGQEIGRASCRERV